MNYWILQSNPAKFRLLDWLQDFNWIKDPGLIDCWSISFFSKEVSNEDIVFIWKSKGKDKVMGIYAKGKIVPIPASFPLEDKEKLYFLDKKEMNRLESLHQIALKYTDIYVKRPLLEDLITVEPLLRDLAILSNKRHGIHRVDHKMGSIIEDMLDKLIV